MVLSIHYMDDLFSFFVNLYDLLSIFPYGMIKSIDLGKFDHDLTVLPNPGIMVNKRNHPQMAARFRLVNYYNLPR